MGRGGGDYDESSVSSAAVLLGEMDGWGSGNSERINVSKTGGLFHFSGRAGMVKRIGTVPWQPMPKYSSEGETKKKREEWLSRLSLARSYLP